MTDKMNPTDREVMVAATLAAGCIDVETTAEQAVEVFREILFEIGKGGGIAALRRRAHESLALVKAHDSPTNRK